MQIKPVQKGADIKAFLEVNVAMNMDNPNYIQPLNHEVEAVFNPQKNKLFKYGSIQRWILVDESGATIGRIAAFTNTKYVNKGTDFATGGIGFFDCIDNQSAANLLFDTAKEWLQQQGMAAMDGPINFGDRDKWWGLLVDGFDKEPVYGLSFNPPYYQKLFEGYGFQNYYNQYYYAMNVDDPLPARFAERHAKFKAKKGYEARHANLNELEKYASDFAEVYNQAWAQHGEAKEITKEQVLKLFVSMKPIMDPRMVWFAYYNNEPIAMFINIPDVNQYFKYFKGKFGWWQKLQLLWMKQRGTCKKLTGLAFGVIPKYQALGIDSFLIYESALLVQGKGWYESYEMGWAGDWNPKMINIYKSLGAIQSRCLITYRYIFDTSIHPFERHPPMEYKQ
ncbi:MAG: hypothetical protein KGK14_01825 [Bacteroidota bacterium]|nr:hypothetical protein [Bacteroidota bacterium]